MKKITDKICRAFEERRTLRIDNTETDGTSLWLFGNQIAAWERGGIWISNAGWNSKTTKERLNGLTGVNIRQSKGKWYLNGEEWDGDWIKISDNDMPEPEKSDKVFIEASHWIGGTHSHVGYFEPLYAVCGANDTGMYSDSPCPSNVCSYELENATAELKKFKIPVKQIVTETSNVFCAHRYLIVPPKYLETAKEVISDYHDRTETRLLYKC